MESVTIKSNGHRRELAAWYDLPITVAKDWFGYVESDDERMTARFFEYRGSWYDAHEFDAGEVSQRSDWLSGWDAWQTESYFSAVLIRFPFEWDGITVDYDSVVVAYAHW